MPEKLRSIVRNDFLIYSLLICAFCVSVFCILWFMFAWCRFRLQLRQHSFMKHRGKSPKWLDTTTGKVCGDESSQPSSTFSTTTAPVPAQTSTNPLPGPAVQSRKPTARKSTSQSGIRVAVFRCGDVFSIRSCNAVDEDSPATSGTSTEFSVDSGISQSESLEQIVPPPLLCCLACTFASRSMTGFADHLRSSDHPTVSVRIEILAADDPITPRRCGFCSYQTFSDPDFSDHVSSIHGMSQPLLCSVCEKFAAFEVSELRRHFAEDHPTCSVEYMSLLLPYSMYADVQSSESSDHVTRDGSYTLNPTVDVVDIADMSQVEFSDLLDLHSVWFDYW